MLMITPRRAPYERRQPGRQGWRSRDGKRTYIAEILVGSLFFPENREISKKNREAIEHERAIH
jgi:hypothetical protein